MFKNTTKEKLKNGQAVWGAMVYDYSISALEIFGHLGFDWLLLDNEHGHITTQVFPQCVQSCESSNITPIVRPIGNTPEIIRPFLDLGAHGIQAPQVQTAEEAKIIVDSVKYPPVGKRGYFVANRNNKFGLGMSAPDYLNHGNQETLVCIMVETPQGIENAEEIAKVDGVDVVFVGHGDLSTAMGYPGQMTHPKVVEAGKKALGKVLDVGKWAGCSCPEDQTTMWLEFGVRYFHSSVNRLLISGAKQYLDKVHEESNRLGL
ncbi:MAG: 2-dehydro-3-deoxyglucarate aldolase [SAR202 cluster bacterium]|jgi:2-keto-3-deoxy-L-rhamnonate aldolase RhmA|nr:aldolase/citrate lyase family protein [Dehalococcoidia bacterium]MQG84843.1 2-dehydro-3-deoxyglucarate aldolase [SAR202 cluster bacterium]|tara:strand:+ start:2479 stop:3261 length:783 start_codon:yes stop_codon:yes gene_type:complete